MTAVASVKQVLGIKTPSLEQLRESLDGAEAALQSNVTAETLSARDVARAKLEVAQARQRDEDAKAAAAKRVVDLQRFTELRSFLEPGHISREIQAPAAKRMATLFEQMHQEAEKMERELGLIDEMRAEAKQLGASLGRSDVPPALEAWMTHAPIREALAPFVRYRGLGMTFLFLPKV